MTQKWYIRVLLLAIAIQAYSYIFLPECVERAMVNFATFAVAALSCVLYEIQKRRAVAK